MIWRRWRASWNIITEGNRSARKWRLAIANYLVTMRKTLVRRWFHR